MPPAAAWQRKIYGETADMAFPFGGRLSLFALFGKQKPYGIAFHTVYFYACLYQSATAGWSISSSGGRSSSSNSSSREAS